MGRFQNFDEIYSALYVDFDNIYVRLAEQDPVLARTFATNPQRWLRWLEGHALRMMYGDGVRRRLLKRCCYINPVKYHEFRPYFLRSAFQITDCPPFMSQGKTSADVHLVMDCMDALNHTTRFDEFIILSGDADFTPLLLRIQEHARRTLVLSVGYTSPAYSAACSWRIREDWFLSQALEETKEDSERELEARQQDRDERYLHGADRNGKEANSRKERSGAPISLPVFKRIRLVEAIKQLVDESSVPVPLPSVAQVLQREQEAPSDWFGAGTLRDLLEVLDLAPIVFSPAGEGFVFDPKRHSTPEGGGAGGGFSQSNPDLYEFAMKVHRLTDVPLLSPGQYEQLFALIADEVNELGFSRTATVRNLEEECESDGLPANAAQIAFVLEAVIRGGINLAAKGKKSQPVDAAMLSDAFVRSTVDLCRLSQLPIGEREQELLAAWLG
ncbi:NYN domain-containing protein [Desulfovibrio sp. OttesenSCG-928-G15]|nr:NYN domain-containing protein [Desulfovibrio sp. OttesenSCG-928-G15]